MSPGKISAAHQVVLKHRPAHLSLHPSVAPAWSSTATYPYLKLQKPLLWVAYHPCNDKVQMWIHSHGSESHWNPLWKVPVATATTVNLQSTRCLNGLEFLRGCRLKMSSTLSRTRELNPFYNMPLLRGLARLAMYLFIFFFFSHSTLSSSTFSKHKGALVRHLCWCGHTIHQMRLLLIPTSVHEAESYRENMKHRKQVQ